MRPMVKRDAYRYVGHRVHCDVHFLNDFDYNREARRTVARGFLDRKWALSEGRPAGKRNSAHPYPTNAASFLTRVDVFDCQTPFRSPEWKDLNLPQTDSGKALVWEPRAEASLPVSIDETRNLTGG
jgi:hypothetical protein